VISLDAAAVDQLTLAHVVDWLLNEEVRRRNKCSVEEVAGNVGGETALLTGGTGSNLGSGASAAAFMHVVGAERPVTSRKTARKNQRQRKQLMYSFQTSRSCRT
jgi:hypothetical protein